MRSAIFWALWALIAIAPHSFGAEWRQITTTRSRPDSESSEQRYYIDQASLKRTDHLVEAWILIDFASPRQFLVPGGPKDYRSLKMLSLFDCKARRQATVRALMLDGNMGTGAVVNDKVFVEQRTDINWNGVRENIDWERKQFDSACTIR